MVGARHRAANGRPKRNNDNDAESNGHNYYANDLEAGRDIPPKFRFRDAVSQTIDSTIVSKIKKQLHEGLEGMDRKSLEKYRKSVEELKETKNKKVRKFYQDQNERLNDWLEVDAIVMAMADEVLDSMNPRDEDHDGIAESGGALQATEESVEPLLPDDEREKRRRERRNAKWAINVSCTFIWTVVCADSLVHR